MIITFAMQILVLDVPITQGALGVYLAPLPLTPLGVERLFFFIFLAFALLTTILIFAIEHSNFGWALVAIREDEDAAEIVGVRTTEVKWVANALAAAIAGGPLRAAHHVPRADRNVRAGRRDERHRPPAPTLRAGKTDGEERVASSESALRL
jgi:ABC-type uncharacterized transport system permease subunit